MVCLVSDFMSELKIKGFDVYQIRSDSKRIRTYNRKGFYSICLYTGKHLIHYGERSYETNGAILFFANPDIAYSCEMVTSTGAFYVSIFNEDFFEVDECSDCLKQSSLFTLSGTPFLTLNTQQKKFAIEIFEKMIEEQMSCYTYKEELIRNYINLLIHEALKGSSL